MLIAAWAQPPAADSQENRFDVEPRGSVLPDDGGPANDIPGFGIIARYWLDDRWFAGAALDAYEYDFRKPTTLVRVAQNPTVDVIDAPGEVTVLSGMIGRRFGENDGGFDWFWTAGVGVGFPDVADVAGPTNMGGTFDLTFDGRAEFRLMTTLGTSYHFTPKWFAAFAARLEHRFVDATITDRESGATDTEDAQSPVGAYISLGYSF